MNSKEIKPTDGRKGNSRKKSIPILPVPEIERSNKPAMNTAKKNRKKQYSRKALKNVFGSEALAIEALAKKAKDTGNVNAYKMLFEYAYEEEEDGTKGVSKAPTINFFGDSEIGKKVKDRIIDVTQSDE